jgi:hypothetical protein
MPDFRIQVRSNPTCRIPDEVNLRRLLKLLLRSYGLVCVDVAEVNPDALDAADKPDDGLAGTIAAPGKTAGATERQRGKSN